MVVTKLRTLRVGMVAPPWFQIPPRAYGGIESMCSYLVDGLVARGHEVTLIAAADHATQANRFVRSFNEPPSTRLGEAMPEVVHAAKAERELAEWQPDIVHDHSLAGPLAAGSREAATIVTAHGPVEGEMGYYYRHLDPRVRLVAISDAQRNNAPDLQWVGRVYNAAPSMNIRSATSRRTSPFSLGECIPPRHLISQ